MRAIFTAKQKSRARIPGSWDVSAGCGKSASAVSAAELVYATSRIDQTLFAGVKRMASCANFDLQIFAVG
jgi:hypothetical protein